MDVLKGLVYEFWQWIPKWQFYGALGLTVVLWLFRKSALSRLVLIVAAVAWAAGFALHESEMVAGLGATALHFAVFAGGAGAVALFWFLFLRSP